MEGLGRYTFFLGSLFVNRESFSTYWKLTLQECVNIGVNSLFLMGIVSAFIGAVSTIQTAYNMISPFIPDSVIATIIRDLTLLEMAPSIMALVYAGKIGSNMAGELGTMRITEQIDAMEVMGINSSSYLVLPKILASIFCYPLLVALCICLTITGGYIAGVSSGIISSVDFIQGLKIDFVPYNVFFALVKAVVFGFLVASISSFQGFYIVGGAFEVGKASTTAVKKSCIAILLADYFLAKILLPT